MGMTIEDIILELEEAKNYPISNEAVNYALDTIHKYLLMQSDYETRLKADMVAMLTDMLIDVEEIASREQWCDYANDNCISRYDVEDLFQQKINSLKEAHNDREKDI